jgi:hypothetical protein
MAATISRRAFVTATAASVVTPNAARAKECPAAGMDWMTMSLEARNLAYNNGEHVGLDYALTKTESWIAASKALREQRSKHLDLPYASGERTKWDLRCHSPAHSCRQAQRFPNPPPLDPHGLPMAIWA